MTQDQTNDAEWNDPANWHGGALGLYYAPRDSRAWVPKRTPWMGWTVNFARPAGVAGLALLVGVVVLVERLVR